MGIRLLELKTDTDDRHDYLIKESMCEEIINWETMPCVKDVKKYMETHPFPTDKRYTKEEFLWNIEKVTGYVYLSVEKIETAEYIQELIYKLI